jgi:hypothetical protein
MYFSSLTRLSSLPDESYAPPVSLASVIGRKAILVCQICRKTSPVPDENRCEAAVPLTNRLGFQEIELPTNFR